MGIHSALLYSALLYYLALLYSALSVPVVYVSGLGPEEMGRDAGEIKGDVTG
jgi:hypothetical protein